MHKNFYFEYVTEFIGCQIGTDTTTFVYADAINSVLQYWCYKFLLRFRICSGRVFGFFSALHKIYHLEVKIKCCATTTYLAARKFKPYSRRTRDRNLFSTFWCSIRNQVGKLIKTARSVQNVPEWGLCGSLVRQFLNWIRCNTAEECPIKPLLSAIWNHKTENLLGKASISSLVLRLLEYRQKVLLKYLYC